MREILFRGKQLDNGEWVYGYYVHIGPVSCQRAYIIPEYASAIYVKEVDPSTVDQYTGLKDKNGKRIFEGDILGTRYYYFSPDNVAVEVVKWFCNSWVLQEGDHPPTMLEEDEIMPYSEVIGNVHDNKGLWGGNEL